MKLTISIASAICFAAAGCALGEAFHDTVTSPEFQDAAQQAVGGAVAGGFNPVSLVTSVGAVLGPLLSGIALRLINKEKKQPSRAAPEVETLKVQLAEIQSKLESAGM